MKSSIDAHIEFSFKGEIHALSSTIDLDKFAGHSDFLPSVYALLAQEHGIDTYSYLYEVMQEEEIEFSNASGIAADYLADGNFDYRAFVSCREDREILALIQPIALRELGIAHLGQHEALGNAFLQVYALGRKAAERERY